MLKNYLTIAWRNLLKNKLFSSINIIGLALGMAIALLIGLWIADELQFDHYYQHHDRLARVAVLPYIHEDTIYTNLTIQMPLGNELRTKYGKDLKYTSLVAGGGTHIIAAGDQKVSGQAMYAQKDFPEMFSLDMVRGGRDVLKDPTTCMISQSMALAVFGRQDPINKTILIDNGIELKVGGVYKDLPENTTFYEMACIMPWENKANWFNSKDPQGNWYNHCGALFVQVRDNVSMEQAAAGVKEAPTSHIQGYTENATLFALDKLHLYNEFTNGKMSGGRIQTVWLFGIIGVFVLLLACINFMNLSTARRDTQSHWLTAFTTDRTIHQRIFGCIIFVHAAGACPGADFTSLFQWAGGQTHVPSLGQWSFVGASLHVHFPDRSDRRQLSGLLFIGFQADQSA